MVRTVATSVLAEANGTPQVGGILGDAPIGLYTSAKTYSGTENQNAIAIFAETNSFGWDIHNTIVTSTVLLAPLSPEERTKQRLGARGYARAMSAIRAGETGR